MACFDVHSKFSPACEVLLVTRGVPTMQQFVLLHNASIDVCLDFSIDYYVDLLGHGKARSLLEIQRNPVADQFRVYAAKLKIDPKISTNQLKVDLSVCKPLKMSDVYRSSKQYCSFAQVPSRRIWQVEFPEPEAAKAIVKAEPEIVELPEIEGIENI